MVLRQSTFQPARLRRFFRLVVGLARDSRLSAVWRVMAMFWGRPVAAPEAGEIVAKYHVQHPVVWCRVVSPVVV